MSKKARKVLALAIALVMAIAALFPLSQSRESGSHFEDEFDVVDSKVVPDYKALPGGGSFIPDKDVYGFYRVVVSSEPEEGVIIGCCVKDSAGNQVFCLTGSGYEAESSMLNFKAGEEYTEEFEVLTSKENYEKYVKEHFDDEEIGDIDESFFKDGHYKVNYSIEVKERVKHAREFSLIVGFIIGLLLVMIAFTVAKNDEVQIEYDERQIAMQGKSYKYAFFAMLGYYGFWMLLEAFSISIPASKTLLIFLGVAVGIAVMLTNSILKDAYFKLNENRKCFVGFFIFIGILNIGIGVTHIVRGTFIDEGVVTASGSLNLLCGLLICYLLVLLLIKKIKDKRDEE